MSLDIRWLNDYSKEFLERDYLLPGQTVVDRIAVIGNTAEKILGIEGFSDKVQRYISYGWISLSTPIWTNFGTTRGLPISCFGSYIEDSVDGILYALAEVGKMNSCGGGTSGYFGDVRPRGALITNNGTSSGTKPFLEFFQSCSNTINQGSVRRGYFSGYINIDHGDIDEWLNIRGEGDPIQFITWGLCVPTWWINSMKEGDSEKRKKWAKVIQKRNETGMPYIIYTDNANNSLVDVYKDKGMKIKASNMCSEIFLPSNKDESFVCCLLSFNDLYYDEWKDTDCVEVGTFLLDAVMTEFIEKSKSINYLDRANRFAERHRALGLGRLGYHSLLQSKMIAFESLEARNLNIEIQKNIFDKAYRASKKLAELFGEPELLKGYGRRNTTLISIAPNTSSSFILGQVSQSIEPYNSNFYIKDLSKGVFVIRNKYLKKLLEEKEKDTQDVWNTIKNNHGSVQHLDFLSDKEKAVFKTFNEIDQNEIILQAAHRQKYIDQGQSLNISISADVTVKEINSLMLKAHDLGIKSLYYQHNVNAAQELTKKLTCVSCE